MTINIFKPQLASADDKLPINLLESYINLNTPQQSTGFCFTDEIGSADFFLLPSLWNYYVDNRKIDLAKEFITKSHKFNKKIIIFSTGDYTANGPFEESVIIQSSAFKSRDGFDGNILIANPTFIGDYLTKYCQGRFFYQKYQKKPIVGFCGQSNGTWLDYSRRRINITSKNLRYKLGLIKWEPPKMEPTLFRHNILKKIASSSSIESNFIMRTKYRAGYRQKVKDPFHPTRIEFIENILNTNYTVCMRGGGNFSVRFYETLALGRIPIFINTDCILPFDKMIDYKEYMVWVEENELPVLNQKILDFHNSMNQKKFTDLQIACRNLWQDYLTKDGYFTHLADQLRAILE